MAKAGHGRHHRENDQDYALVGASSPLTFAGGAQVKSHFAQGRGKDGAWADEREIQNSLVIARLDRAIQYATTDVMGAGASILAEVFTGSPGQAG